MAQGRHQAWAVVLVLAAACSQPAPTVCFGNGETSAVRGGYQQLPRPVRTRKRSSMRDEFRQVLSGLLLGVGDRYSFVPPGKSSSVPSHRWARLNGAQVNAQAIWLTRDWNESWVSRQDLEGMAESGVVPVLILYYFAHDISVDWVMRHRDDWYLYLAKVATLASIEWPVLIVLEPEFNDESNNDRTLVVHWPGFNEVVIDAIYLLRSLAPNVLVGLCPGDFGVQDLEASVGEAVAYSDFIAFQEMRASTQEHRIDHDFEEITGRALDYAAWLKQTFDKPILLAYVAVSTWDERAEWLQFQADVVNNLFGGAIPKLQDSGVFGALYFMLIDDPQHEGYFGQAEKHFGLVDTSGRPKPGWHAFSQAVRIHSEKLYRTERDR